MKLEWLPLLLPILRRSDASLKGEARQLAELLAPRVSRLSGGLTRARALVGVDYLADPTLASAYVLYFAQLNRLRCQAVLSAVCSDAWLSARPRLRVLDVGCGPGAASLALVSLLTERARQTGLDVVGVDHSRAALAVFKDIVAALPSSPAVRLQPELLKLPAQPLPAGPFDLVLVSYALNEWFEGQPLSAAWSWMQQCLDRLAPGGLLVVVEPALQSTTQRIQGLRELALARSDMAILSPCTHRATCPLLGPGAPPQQWCHQELRRPLEPFFQHVDRLTGLKNERLALSHLVLQRQAAASGVIEVAAEQEVQRREGQWYRALSPALSGRGLVTVQACGEDGFVPIELMTRLKSPLETSFESIQRGDQVWLSDLEDKGSRRRVTAASELRRASLSGEELLDAGDS